MSYAQEGPAPRDLLFALDVYAIGVYLGEVSDKAFITVVETRAYINKAERLLSDEEQHAVVDMVAEDPECGVLIKGTGGVRKVRFALEGKGKSGGARVVYFFHNLEMPLYLLAVFAKNQKSSLTQAEKASLKRLTTALVRAHLGGSDAQP